MLVVTNQLNWQIPSRIREKWRKLSMWRDEGNFWNGGHILPRSSKTKFWNLFLVTVYSKGTIRESQRILAPVFAARRLLAFFILYPLRKISFLMNLAQCINGSIPKRLYRSFFTSAEKYQEMEIYKIIRFCCLYFICSGAIENISSNWLVYVAM